MYQHYHSKWYHFRVVIRLAKMASVFLLVSLQNPANRGPIYCSPFKCNPESLPWITPLVASLQVLLGTSDRPWQKTNINLRVSSSQTTLHLKPSPPDAPESSWARKPPGFQTPAPLWVSTGKSESSIGSRSQERLGPEKKQKTKDPPQVFEPFGDRAIDFGRALRRLRRFRLSGGAAEGRDPLGAGGGGATGRQGLPGRREGFLGVGFWSCCFLLFFLKKKKKKKKNNRQNDHRRKHTHWFGLCVCVCFFVFLV